jgi:hypothetical protein
MAMLLKSSNIEKGIDVYFSFAPTKNKVVPVHTVKAYRESRSVVPLIRNFDTE